MVLDVCLLTQTSKIQIWDKSSLQEKGSHCFLSALLLPPSQRPTFFLISKREMSRPHFAPKLTLTQHLPEFYTGIPKVLVLILELSDFSQAALSGEMAVGRKVLSVPQVLRLGKGRLPWLSLTAADSGLVLGARIPLHLLVQTVRTFRPQGKVPGTLPPGGGGVLSGDPRPGCPPPRVTTRD